MSGNASAVKREAETNPLCFGAASMQDRRMLIRIVLLSLLALPVGVTTLTAAPLGYCGTGSAENCVVDGDTFRWRGQKIRIADIDTPEIGQAKCSAERALGIEAKRRLAQLLSAGGFSLLSWPGRDEDRYGRKLRVVMRDGQSLGDQLMREGLARTWTGRREPWCGVSP